MRASQKNANQYKSDNKERGMWKARESRKLPSDSEKLCSIHIQAAVADNKTSD